MRRALSARSVILLLVLFGSACASSVAPGSTGGAGSPTASGPTAGHTPSSSPGGPVDVPEILDFQAQRVGGGTFDAAELAGAPVAIWFWAPW